MYQESSLKVLFLFTYLKNEKKVFLGRVLLYFQEVSDQVVLGSIEIVRN